MNEFEMLKELGAGDFQHLNGSLATHLKATKKIRQQWGSSELLQTAGLFHAAYGTAGFDEHMVSLNQRKSIADVIGEAEEALVYLYCSCDRDYVLPQFDKSDNIQFKDRFNGSLISLNEFQSKLFCDLTVANELEFVLDNEELKAKYGAKSLELFQNMENHLSPMARDAYKTALKYLNLLEVH